MKQSVEFDSISLTRLDNALHLSFHEQVYDYYTDGTVETETVYLTPDFLAEWKGAIDLEVDINRETTASATTLTLAELEAARDGWLSYLFQAIHTAKIMPKQAMKEAGERMAVVTDKYAGIQKEAVDRETVHIEGLLLDLSDLALAEDIETLGLGEAIEEIRMAKDAYKAKSKERNVARVDDKLPLTRDARQHTDACFERACLLTKAALFWGSGLAFFFQIQTKSVFIRNFATEKDKNTQNHGKNGREKGETQETEQSRRMDAEQTRTSLERTLHRGGIRKGLEIGYEMRLYLDTNILYFMIVDICQLDNDVSFAIDDYSNTLYTSTICIHELMHLDQIGKLKRPKDVPNIMAWIEEQGIKVVHVKETHLSEFERMPLVGDHRDPNDRLIIAQAIADKATLVSSDRKFSGYRKFGLDFMFNER